MGRKRKTIEQFIKEAMLIHGDKYDYGQTEYLGANIKTIFICNKHGKYKQEPNVHLRGHGCPKCGVTLLSKSIMNTTSDFIRNSIEKHGNLYSYDNSNYKGNRKSIIITCKKHGDFNQIARYHLDGNGCPSCNKSKGEKKIKKYLIENNIHFELEKRFKECRNILPLPFDFYIQEKNLLIEYDGEQHFNVVDGWGGNDKFEIRKQNDKIKNIFAKNNGIDLVRIPYTNYNKINEILIKII